MDKNNEKIHYILYEIMIHNQLGNVIYIRLIYRGSKVWASPQTLSNNAHIGKHYNNKTQTEFYTT